MIKNNRNLLQLWLIAIVIVNAMIVGCTQNKDDSIKADLATKAMSEKDFQGVRFTVENGVVTFSGECPTEKSKGAVEEKAKKLYGVKSVVNNITIAPVVIGTDEVLKQRVDSVLKRYASVEAITKDSVVHLQGKLENDKIQKLTDAINSLQPKSVDNQLAVK